MEKKLSPNFIAQSPFGYLCHSKNGGLFEDSFFIRVSPLDIKKLNINSIIYSASEHSHYGHSAHGSFGKVCKINDVLLTVVIR